MTIDLVANSECDIQTVLFVNGYDFFCTDANTRRTNNISCLTRFTLTAVSCFYPTCVIEIVIVYYSIIPEYSLIHGILSTLVIVHLSYPKK